MSYVLARRDEMDGCVAIKARLGHDLVELKRDIYSQVEYSAIELITISRPSAYGEYAPYRVVETEEEFKEAICQMVEKKID